MEKLIKSILYEIAEKTYNKKPQNFELKIVPEERKSFHGQYWADKKRIEIFNLSRPTEYVISTTIHELAHHIEYCNHSNLKHDKAFYKVFKELLETAIKIGYVDYEFVRNKSDSVDIAQMEKHFGKINVKYDPSMDANKNYSLLKVKNSYSIKDKLNKLKYFYNYTEKIMQKKVHNDKLQEEIENLKLMDKNVKYEIIPFSKIQINITYYVIIIGETYEHKEELKDLGYIFNGYGQKDNKWIKKINAKDLDEEANKIKALNLSYKIKHSLTNKKHG